MTCKETLAFYGGVSLGGKEWPRAKRIERVEEVLAAVGLAHTVNTLVSGFDRWRLGKGLVVQERGMEGEVSGAGLAYGGGCSSCYAVDPLRLVQQVTPRELGW
jgi:hypothetical protein